MSEVTTQITRTGQTPAVEGILLDRIKAANELYAQVLGDQALRDRITPERQIAGLDPMSIAAQQLAASGVGAYQPYFDQAGENILGGLDLLRQGIDMGQFDPNREVATDPLTGQGIKAFEQYMNPYVDQVVDTARADMQRALAAENQKNAQLAASRGAFGGSRAAVLDAMTLDDQLRSFGDVAGGLRAKGYADALTQAQDAFDTQRTFLRGAATDQANLGVTQAGLGQNLQAAGITDFVNLDTFGRANQQLQQTMLDAARQNQLDDAQLPFRMLNFLNQGTLPSGQQTTTVSGAPAGGGGSTAGNALGFALGAASTLGQLNNPSGTVV